MVDAPNPDSVVAMAAWDELPAAVRRAAVRCQTVPSMNAVISRCASGGDPEDIGRQERRREKARREMLLVMAGV